MKQILILMMIGLSPILAQSVTVNEKDFKEALMEAVDETKGEISHFEQTYVKDFKPIKGVKYVISNTWDVAGTAVLKSASSNTYNTFTKNIRVFNAGTHFEIFAGSQALNPEIMDKIAETSHIQGAREYLIDEIDDCEVKFEKKGNQFTIYAKYVYDEDTDVDEIAERIFPVLHIARSLPRNYQFAYDDAMEDFLDELDSREIKSLTKFEYLALTKDNTLNSYKVKVKSTLGSWRFKNNDANIDHQIYLYKDKMIYRLYRKLSNDLSKEKKDDVVKKLQEYVDDEGMDNASKHVVKLLNKGLYIAVEFTFPFDGSYEGEYLREMYWAIWEDYSGDLGDELDDFLEE